MSTPGVGSTRWLVKAIQLITIFGMVAMVRRPGGIRKSDFLRTPHDWLMLVMFTFIVVTSGRMQHLCGIASSLCFLLSNCSVSFAQSGRLGEVLVLLSQ